MPDGRYEQILTRWVGLNPAVLVLELRTRWRGVKPFLVLTGCALLPVLVFALMAAVQSYHGGVSVEGRGLAPAVVVPTAYMLLLLLLVIIPVQAAGAMTLEPSTRTLDLLRAALLTPGDVLWGKLLATLAYALLLVLTALPVLTWSLLLGGSSLPGIALALSYLFAIAVMLACTGMAVASLFSRTPGAAIPVTYALVAFVFAVGPGIAWLLRARQTVALARAPVVATNPLAMGSGPALFLALAMGAVIGALVYIGARRVVPRVVPGVSHSAANALAAVFAIVTGGALMRLASTQFVPWLAEAEWDRLLALHPFSVVRGLLAGESISSGLRTLGPAASYEEARLWLWLAATGLALGWSAVAWVIARRTYEAGLG
jgi:hypothetical protein